MLIACTDYELKNVDEDTTAQMLLSPIWKQKKRLIPARQRIRNHRKDRTMKVLKRKSTESYIHFDIEEVSTYKMQ